MKKSILIIAIAGILVFQNSFDAMCQKVESGKTLRSTTSPLVAINGKVTGSTENSTVAQKLTTISNPKVQKSSINESPADISLAQWKDILSSNNQVVNQVASMYQHFGLFLTIIVTLVGGIATWLSFMAKRSVNEFIKEWTDKMKSIESEIKSSMSKLHEAVSEAETSAKKAASHEESLKDNISILDQALKDADHLKTVILNQAKGFDGKPDLPPLSIKESVSPPSVQSPTSDEDAEVAALLKGKINITENEGSKS